MNTFAADKHTLRVYAVLVATVLLLLGALGQGCPDAGPDPNGPDNEPPDGTPPPVLRLGVSDDGAFRALEDGDEIAVHRGSQGGIHIFLSMRIMHVTGVKSLLVAQKMTFDDDGEQAAAETEVLVSTLEQGDDHIDLLDHFIVLFGTTPDTVRDRLVRVEITVRDSAQNTMLEVSESVTLRFVDAQ